MKDQDVEEGSPDRLGETLDASDIPPADTGDQPAVASTASSPNVTASVVVPAAMRQSEPAAPAAPKENQTAMPEEKSGATPLPIHLRSSGTVVLDVEQGGIAVPSFLGKSVRTAIEMAQESGLDLDVVGSGLAREQSPLPGSHVASGSQVTVKFGR